MTSNRTFPLWGTIGALTAWQGLFDRAHLQAGEHVLVHGGAGAVGIFAIQLARLCGRT